MKPIRFLLTILPLTTLPVTTAAPAAAAADPAVWPLTPRPPVVRGFDLPAKPWLPGHRGVDLSGSPGQPVRAATSGTITYAGQLAGRGVVVVSYGARRTTYEPVVPSVAVGSAVTPGTVIGRLSAVGSHCKPAACLHWGLVAGRQYLNPLSLLPDRPVRLLPLARTADPPPAAATSEGHPPDPHPPGAITAVPQPAGATGSEVHPSPRSADLPPRALVDTSAPQGGERTAAAVVATTAALTLAAGLMIRRH